MNEHDHALNEEGRDLWNQKAAFWDGMHGEEGNLFHRTLISPAVERLLALRPGERVLDVACGNGVLARRLAVLGADVTAVDFSAELLALAQRRGQPGGSPIRYQIADATDEAALTALGAGSFDAVVCSMAIMDIPVLGPLFSAVSALLKPEGRFVFATAHPAFNSNNPIFFGEELDIEGKRITLTGLKLTAYMDLAPVKGMGAPGEPNPHYYFHRPLSELLNEAFAAGLVLDGIEEAAFTDEYKRENRPLSWTNLGQFPPILAGRFRPAAR